MAVTFVQVPDIGDFENIPVVEILVAPGEAVAAEQALVTLESDKATMDVPAPYPGTVGDIKVTVGDLVSEGSVLLELNVESETAVPLEAKPVPRASDAKPAPVHAAVSGTAGRSSGSTPDPEQTLQDASALMPPAEPPSTRSASLEQQLPAAKSQTSHATPAVRRFARTLGADLHAIAGSGLKGRIQRSDVERHIRDRLAQRPPPQASGNAGIPPIAPVDFARHGPIETQALSRVQRISGPFLQRAWLNVPHVTYQDDADITELEDFRKRLKNDPVANGARMTLLPFVMKVLCAALREFPTFNSSLSPDGEALILKRYFHLGVAVDTPPGLVVPVIRDVDGKTLMALGQELADVSARAREGKLKPTELQGGCMSISSLGGIGGKGFTPLVNAPEVAILGIARSRLTPVWDGAAFVPRLMLPLNLSFDHRVVDGAQAARFMNYLCTHLGDIRKLLL